MPLREDLLEPIPGENPSGANLKYDRVFDQVKEARTEEDDTLPAGAWERTAKRADSRLVLKLAGEALAKRTKDLQMAAWLGEASIRMEGAAAVEPVLTLLLELQKGFWNSIYPEIDEGDAGLRAVPLQWAANRYATLIYDLPLTRSGINYQEYKAARAIGYEADAAGSETKQKARADAVKNGKRVSEDVDQGIKETPKSFYATLNDQLQSSREVLEDLSIYCEEQYGEDGPSFRRLRDSLDEAHNLVGALLAEKRLVEPDPVQVAVEPEPEPEFVSAAPVPVAAAPPVAAPVQAAPAPPPAAVASPRTSATPQSWDEAAALVHETAAYMHSQRPGSSVPYLLHAALRWGELRKHGPQPPLDTLVGPSSDTRSGLKLVYAEQAWATLLERGMEAMKQPCARAWLDLHRYLWHATSESGYKPFAAMILGSVRGILSEYPEMPHWTFADDTAVANADTQQWIEQEVLAGQAPAAEHLSMESMEAASPVLLPPVPIAVQLPPMEAGAGEVDIFAEAATLAAAGSLSAATAMLARDAAQQASGRMRYQRRMQIAELCLAGGSAGVALPILRELIDEMERRNLESWEAGELVTRPLALLLRVQDGSMNAVEHDTLFTRLCRLDPSAALALG